PDTNLTLTGTPDERVKQILDAVAGKPAFSKVEFNPGDVVPPSTTAVQAGWVGAGGGKVGAGMFVFQPSTDRTADVESPRASPVAVALNGGGQVSRIIAAEAPAGTALPANGATVVLLFATQ